MLTLLVLGCLDPFPHDRHDLVDLRIVGMRRDEVGELDAYVWEGAEAWSAAAPERVWGGDAVCVDAGCTLIAGRDATLTVIGQDGEETGLLETDALAGQPALDGYGAAIRAADALVHVTVSNAERVRWMAPAGTIDEIDATSMTFYPPGDGVWPVVALWLNGHGGNDWMTFDLGFGDVGPQLVVDARILATDGTGGGLEGALLATIEASDELAGIRLVDLAADDGSELDPVCGDRGGRWEPDSLMERRCGRDEVLGKRVRLTGSARP